MYQYKYANLHIHITQVVNDKGGDGNFFVYNTELFKNVQKYTLLI